MEYNSKPTRLITRSFTHSRFTVSDYCKNCIRPLNTERSYKRQSSAPKFRSRNSSWKRKWQWNQRSSDNSFPSIFLWSMFWFCRNKYSISTISHEWLWYTVIYSAIKNDLTQNLSIFKFRAVRELPTMAVVEDSSVVPRPLFSHSARSFAVSLRCVTVSYSV